MFHKLQKSSRRSRSRFSCLKGVDSISLAFISITALTTVCFSRDLCPSSWTFSKYSGTCNFFLYNRPLNWQSARQWCKGVQSDLAVIQNMDHNNFLHAMVRSSTDGFWIGLSDLKKPGEYKWLDSNEQPKFQNWKLHQPNNPEHQCVQINNEFGRPTKQWTDDHCEEQHVNFICEKNLETMGKCPAEWIWSTKSGTCMRIFRNEMSWRSAKEHCIKYGAELLMILNEETNNFLQEFLYPHDEYFWFGLSNLKDQNTYKWMDYADELNYTKWPSDPHVEGTKCGRIKEPQEGWDIADCEQKRKFICEKYRDDCIKHADAICPVNCSSSCQDNACNKRSGVCTLGCIDGFKGPRCDEMCTGNTYGKACNSTCNPNCGGPDKACNVSTGICLHGCSGAFSGLFCSNYTLSNREDKEGSSSFFESIGWILFILLLATLLLLLLAKKKAAKEGEQEDKQSKPTQIEIQEEVIEEAIEEHGSEAPRKSRKSIKGLKEPTDEEQVEDPENKDQPNPDS